jgi:Holliday junction resolvasome RuvABC ATP-dependent DNA helicase subunit
MRIAGMDHAKERWKSLFVGPAGGGKTTLMTLVVNRIQHVRIRKAIDPGFSFEVSGNQVTSRQVLDELMLQLRDHPYGFLVIDEVHTLIDQIGGGGESLLWPPVRGSDSRSADLCHRGL